MKKLYLSTGYGHYWFKKKAYGIAFDPGQRDLVF